VLNKKILIAVIISLIIISSGLLYSFYIPNNDIMLDKNNLNYKNEFNLLSNNTTKIFIINMSLINVPTGYLTIYPLIKLSILSNQNINMSLKNDSNNFMYYAILSHKVNFTASYNEKFSYMRNDKYLLGVYGYPDNFLMQQIKSENNNFSMIPQLFIKVRSEINYHLSLIIEENNCLPNVHNNYHNKYHLQIHLYSIKIIDNTHGYYHKFDFYNGVNHFISPEVKILNVTT